MLSFINKWKKLINIKGGILSPKLFNEFLFDLSKYPDKSYGISINNLILTHILCADDIVLLADTAKALQNNFNALLRFCKKWHLLVNVKKTKIIKFNDKSPCGIITTQHNLRKLTVSNTWDICWLISKTCTVKWPIPCDLFDTYILPILEYNSEMWAGEKPINNLEKLQLGYLKNMLGVRKQTSTLAVYSEAGRFPLHVRQKVRMINYWTKLEKLPRW